MTLRMQSDLVIHKEYEPGLFELTLNSPETRNALSYKLLRDLHQALIHISSKAVRGVLISANGPHFSAGHDFRELASDSGTDFSALFELSAKVILSFSEQPFPVVSCVNGAAIGAGCQLALSADMVIAEQNAFFQTPGGSKGWFCYSPMVALTQALPPKVAFELLVSGRKLSAPEALSFGAINALANEDLNQEAKALLSAASQGNKEQIARGKAAFYKIAHLSRSEASWLMAKEMTDTVCQQSPQKRIQAFLKR